VKGRGNLIRDPLTIGLGERSRCGQNNFVESNLAFLSQGRIRLIRNGADPASIESKFGEHLREKMIRAQQRHSWKDQGAGGASLFAGPSLWGRSAAAGGASVPIHITSIAQGTAAGQMLYTLESESMSAVLRIDEFGAEELRIWTGNNERVDRPAVHSEGHIAASVRHSNGTANIGVRLADGRGFPEVTEGDSLDTAPSWVPGNGLKVVFQSAGIGRNRDGHIVKLGAFQIQELELETGKLSVILEEPGTDLLTPRYSKDGSLWFVRRPYSGQRDLPFTTFLKDVVLFPVRLGRAVFGFVDVFSRIFSGKGLTTAGGPPKQAPSLQQMVVWGNLVSAPQPTTDNDAPSLVPDSWQLIRRMNGSNSVMAKGVLSFDLSEGGTILYTNGSAVFSIRPDEKPKRLCREPMIEQVISIYS
jgi:hypothetical protein